MATTKLSIIIPCYNEAASIGSQLKALSRQEYAGSWEVIIADNGSTDNTREEVERYRTSLPHLRFVDASDRRGASYARNEGVKQATGETLLFCDADDEVAPGYVEGMASALQNHDFVACRYEFSKLNHSLAARYHGECQVNGLESLGRYLCAGGGSLGVRRSVHESVCGFDESIPHLEDADYCIRIQRQGIPLHFNTKAIIHVRWPSSVSALAQQGWAWGKSLPIIERRHTSTQGPGKAFYLLTKHLLRLRNVRNSKSLIQWIWTAGWYTGRVHGALRLQKSVTQNNAPFVTKEKEPRPLL